MQSSEPKGSYVMCRDMAIPVDYAVRPWRETGFHFTGRNRRLTTSVVLHATASENPPAAVFHNLGAHKNKLGQPEPLSVHFCVDKDGVVYQMADTELRASHCAAHGLNSLSIGIEFVNRMTALDLPSRGTKRDRVTESIHHRRVTYYELTLAQLRVGVRLTRTLCNLYGLPYRVPLDEAGEPTLYALPESRLRVYTGILGHAHAEENKVDPGLGILRAIQEAGRLPPAAL